MARRSPNPARWIGRWRHSHEEDGAESRVYRREDFDFPPARGRQTLDLRADGTFVTSGPGPTDRPVAAGHGHWRCAGATLVLTYAANHGAHATILACTADRLADRLTDHLVERRATAAD